MLFFSNSLFICKSKTWLIKWMAIFTLFFPIVTNIALELWYRNIFFTFICNFHKITNLSLAYSEFLWYEKINMSWVEELRAWLNMIWYFKKIKFLIKIKVTSRVNEDINLKFDFNYYYYLSINWNDYQTK